MADVASTLRAWSVTAGSNSPAGSTVIGTGLDDNVRQIQATVRQYLASKGTNMASGATVDLSTADGYFVDITGTTTITSFGTEAAGISYLLRLNGALTLTHNATSLILPGGTSILTASGDICQVTSLGSGNWVCTNYVSAGGGPMPTGTVVPYAGTSAPSGWLLCFGQAVSRTTYAGVFAVVSTNYGVGDGATTFNLPDMRGRAVFGKDDMGGSAASRITNANSGITATTLGASGGSELLHSHDHTALTGSSGAHTHGLNSGAGFDAGPGGGGGNTYQTAAGALFNTINLFTATDSGGSHTHSITAAGTGSSQNMPPALVMNYIVKT